MRTFALVIIISFARIASAQVVINEIQISPINERFIELYNPGDIDIDLTDWYIQRKTGGDFSSFVTKSQLNGKTIRSHGYFLISRSQLGNSDVVVGSLVLTENNTIRLRDPKGTDVDHVAWGSIDEGKSYQRTSGSDWSIGAPTPGAADASASSSTTPASASSTNASAAPRGDTVPFKNDLTNFPVDPQIFAKISQQAQTVSVGAATAFTGRVWGLKKEPIENARMMWAFGDGASAEGTSVLHTYYYPGEYTVVLDASSGYYAASDRIRIIAVMPTFALHVGGDETRSFVAVENRGGDELDLSGWQVEVLGKNFVIPKDTFVGAHKILTLASEVTGLATPTGATATLHFPNGALVPLQHDIVAQETKPLQDEKKPVVVAEEDTRGRAPRVPAETASVVMALDTASDSPLFGPQETSPWAWYAGAAFLAVLALLGLRFSRKNNAQGSITADDFEIIEENDDKKDDLF